MAEGESLEDIKAKLKPKKQAISAEMLDTANTYDDKVAVIRMIVSDEAGRVKRVQGNDVKGYQFITATLGVGRKVTDFCPTSAKGRTEGDKNGSASEDTGTEKSRV